jgi:hypothetical protein
MWPEFGSLPLTSSSFASAICRRAAATKLIGFGDGVMKDIQRYHYAMQCHARKTRLGESRTRGWCYDCRFVVENSAAPFARRWSRIPEACPAAKLAIPFNHLRSVQPKGRPALEPPACYLEIAPTWSGYHPMRHHHTLRRIQIDPRPRVPAKSPICFHHENTPASTPTCRQPQNWFRPKMQTAENT